MHGEDQAHRQVHIAEAVADQTLKNLDEAEVAALRQEMPYAQAGPGKDVAELLVETGLSSSKTEAKRFVAENAISLNGQKSQKEQLEEHDFQNGRLIIRRGKAFKDSAIVERN